MATTVQFTPESGSHCVSLTGPACSPRANQLTTLWIPSSTGTAVVLFIVEAVTDAFLELVHQREYMVGGPHDLTAPRSFATMVFEDYAGTPWKACTAETAITVSPTGVVKCSGVPPAWRDGVPPEEMHPASPALIQQTMCATHAFRTPLGERISALQTPDVGECPICTEDNVGLLVLSCGHRACGQCTASWMETDMTRMSCPVCRRTVNWTFQASCINHV
jgi:hypothetical protein